MSAKLHIKTLLLVYFLAFSLLLIPTRVNADSSSNFSLLITPSPLVATITPGQTTDLQLKILNNGDGAENLEVNPRSFSINNTTGQVDISNSAASNVAPWLSFSAPKFSIASGQWFTEQIAVNVPKDAGFSYYFALQITRQVNPKPTSGRYIKASVDDFVLLNVNRPGAVESLSVPSFTVSKHIYQWLPVNFTIRFKNTGNTIVQPNGNIFIQRKSTSKTPIAVLSVNSGGGYILPGTDRILTSSWSNGFPVYQTTTSASGVEVTHLSWNFSKISEFRYGSYSANLVAVYNNGVEDVPINGTVNFWVLPWLIIGILVLIIAVFALGLWSIGRRIIRVLRPKKKKKNSDLTSAKDDQKA